MIIENNITVSKSKKRNFKEMISQMLQPENDFNLNTVRDIYKFYPCKKKKFSEEINETQLLLYRDFEILNQLQRDLQNLKLKTNNLNTKIFELEKSELLLNKDNRKIFNDYDCDMPEIIDIPIEKGKKIFRNWNFDGEEEDDLNETNESSDTNSNCENEIPFVSKSYKIKEKLIDNAIKSEKTLNKIFNNLNPSLQPTKDNGIILYEDMKKLKENMDKDMLINYIMTISRIQNKDSDMEIVFDDLSEVSGQMNVNLNDGGIKYNNKEHEYSHISYNLTDGLSIKKKRFISFISDDDSKSSNKSKSKSIRIPTNDEMYLD